MTQRCKNFDICGDDNTNNRLCDDCKTTFGEELIFIDKEKCPYCLDVNTRVVKWPKCEHFACIPCFVNLFRESIEQYVIETQYDGDISGMTSEDYNKICADNDLYDKMMETNKDFWSYEMSRMDRLAIFEAAEIEMKKCPDCRS
jgi:hypothetical protein